MEKRFDIESALPGAYRAVAALHKFVKDLPFEPLLLELVHMRASQINGCAYCLDMHSKDARALGETEQRLYTLSAWRETPFFTPRERAALAFTEAVTLIADAHVPDDVLTEVQRHFSPSEVAGLLLAITQINVWNRWSIIQGTVPGSYTRPVGQLAG